MKQAFAKTIKGAYGGLPAEVWLLASITLVNRIGTMVLPFLALYITQDMGMSAKFAGAIISIYGLGALAGAYLGGRLTDYMGPFRLMFLSLVLSGIGFLVLEHLHSRWGLGFGLFFLGVFSESFRPAGGTALAQCCPERHRTRAYALDRLAINLGATMGPALGGFLAMREYAWLFRVDGFTCLAAAVILVLLFRNRFGAPVHDESQETALPVLSPWKDRHFLILLFLILISGMGFFQIMSSYPLYLNTVYGLNESAFGLLMALNGLLIITCEMVLIHWVENRNPLRIMAIGSACVGLGFGVLPLGSTMLFAAATVVVWTIGEMLMAPVSAGYIANRAGDKNRGAYLGMFNMTFSLAYILGPVLGMWIYSIFGAGMLWVVVGLSSALVSVGLAGMARNNTPITRPAD